MFQEVAVAVSSAIPMQGELVACASPEITHTMVGPLGFKKLPNRE